MSFQIFTEGAVKLEVEEMVESLNGNDYAISTLAVEQILEWSKVPLKLRKLKHGKVKVQLGDLA